MKTKSKKNRRRRPWVYNPDPNKAWLEAHPDYKYRPGNLLPRPVQTRSLTVSTEFFTAKATWNKIYGVWSCTDADELLKWMLGKTPADVHLQLLKMGADFSWVTEPKPIRKSSAN